MKKKSTTRTTISREAGRDLPANGVTRAVGWTDGDGIEQRARLSLDCYRYTKDTYWLECAFEDCQAGSLDWDLLCETELGTTLPRPKTPRPSGV